MQPSEQLVNLEYESLDVGAYDSEVVLSETDFRQLLF